MRVHDEWLLLHVDQVLLRLVLVLHARRARRTLRREAAAADEPRLMRVRRSARRLRALLGDWARARERVLLLDEPEVVERLRLREVGERDGRRRRREAGLRLVGELRRARGGDGQLRRLVLEVGGLVDRVDGLVGQCVHELNTRMLHVLQVVSDVELTRRIERPSRRLVEARATRIALEVPRDFEMVQLNSAAHAVLDVKAAAFDMMIHVEFATRYSKIS